MLAQQLPGVPGIPDPAPHLPHHQHHWYPPPITSNKTQKSLKPYLRGRQDENPKGDPKGSILPTPHAPSQGVQRQEQVAGVPAPCSISQSHPRLCRWEAAPPNPPHHQKRGDY